AVTAAIETVRLPPDPRLVSFAAELTVIEQITEDIARLKTRRAAGSCDERSRAFWKDEIARLKRLERTLLKALEAAIRAHDDLARLFDLINSVDGVGQRTALSILIRMPEIGLVTRNVAAALVGVAPYDADSGTHVGERHIAGGRQRLRKALYAAALPAAFRWNAQLKVFYRRLTAAGKSHKEALVACARKPI